MNSRRRFVVERKEIVVEFSKDVVEVTEKSKAVQITIGFEEKLVQWMTWKLKGLLSNEGEMSSWVSWAAETGKEWTSHSLLRRTRVDFIYRFSAFRVHYRMVTVAFVYPGVVGCRGGGYLHKHLIGF